MHSTPDGLSHGTGGFRTDPASGTKQNTLIRPIQSCNRLARRYWKASMTCLHFNVQQAQSMQSEPSLPGPHSGVVTN